MIKWISVVLIFIKDEILKPIFSLLSSVQIIINVPHHDDYLKREDIKFRARMNRNGIVIFYFYSRACYLQPDGIVRGLPTSWNATWKPA